MSSKLNIQYGKMSKRWRKQLVCISLIKSTQVRAWRGGGGGGVLEGGGGGAAGRDEEAGGNDIHTSGTMTEQREDVRTDGRDNRAGGQLWSRGVGGYDTVGG